MSRVDVALLPFRVSRPESELRRKNIWLGILKPKSRHGNSGDFCVKAKHADIFALKYIFVTHFAKTCCVFVNVHFLRSEVKTQIIKVNSIIPRSTTDSLNRLRRADPVPINYSCRHNACSREEILAF